MGEEESQPVTWVALQVLGGCAILHGDGTRIVLPTRKTEALLTVLALAGDSGWSRDRLTALLWGDRGETQARHSLSQCLTVLRQTLGEACIRASRDSVMLGRARLTIDALVFERQARGETVVDLAAAAALYRGPLLDGLALREEGFNDWLRLERTRLHDLAVRTLLRLARLERELGNLDAARSALEYALRLEPLAEPAHAELMRLMLDQGHAAEAVRHYAACAALLQSELQVDPGPEIDALRRDALACRPACHVPPTEVAAGERKHVTALAVHWSPGSVTTTDPEDLEAELRAEAEATAIALREMHAHILRASAEGVLALFGTPVATEDHAARACRTALALQARAGRIRPSLALDSGEVVLRGHQADAVPAYGSCLQRAARLAAAVLPGEVVATDTTRALARTRCGFIRLPPLSIDAATGLVAIFRPTSARGAAPRDSTALVERESEVAAVAAALALVSQGDGRVVAIVGEAGIGKSRLVREVLARCVPTGWSVVTAFTDPQFADTPYYALALLLRAHFRLADDMDATAVRARVAASVV